MNLFVLLMIFWRTIPAQSAPQVPLQPCSIATTVQAEIDIVRAVCEGNQARLDYGETRKEEEKARIAVANSPVGAEERFRLLQEWQLAHDDNEDAKNRVSGNFQRAIALSVNYYGIAPQLGNGPIPGGPGRDLSRDVPWLPKYKGRIDRRNDFVEQVVLPGNRVMHARVKGQPDEKKRPGGMTWPNGRADIYDETFDRVLKVGSPRQLGFILNHESIHFNQLRANRWATENLREVEAYRESLRSAGRFGMTAEEIRDIEAAFRENLEKVKEQTRKPWARPRNEPTPEEEARDSKVWNSEKAELDAIRKAQNDLAAELKTDADSRRLREAVAQRELERSARAAQESFRRQANEQARNLLAAWVANSCRNGSMPDWMTAEQVRNAYSDLLVDGTVFNLWDLPYYSGVPCPALLTNLLLREKRDGRPLVDWDRWGDLTRIANERSRSAPPASEVPQTGAPSLPSAEPDEPGRDDGQRLPPSIPRCRYHLWCQ